MKEKEARNWLTGLSDSVNRLDKVKNAREAILDNWNVPPNLIRAKTENGRPENQLDRSFSLDEAIQLQQNFGSAGRHQRPFKLSRLLANFLILLRNSHIRDLHCFHYLHLQHSVVP